MADEGDAAVDRHDEAEPADAQVRSLLLRVPPLRDRGPLVPRVDPGGEVRHVEDQAREVDLERLDHFRHDATLDLLQLSLADRVHRIPKAPVVECPAWKAQPPVAGGLLPPVGEGELRAGIGHPVHSGERDAGPDRRAGVSPASAGDLVDDLCHPKAPEHFPGRGDVAEGEMAAASGLAGAGLGQTGGNLLRRAQIALGDDPGLAVDPGGLGQVVVDLPVLLPADDECHI